jgi:glycerophosphoryl diester phosphodiesterase
MAAFAAAWADGARWTEADTRPTSDGVPVMLHDDDLARTTSGHGSVRDTTAREVTSLDAGSWFSPEFAGERVPELEQVLATLTDERNLLLEIKGPHTDQQLGAMCDVVRASGRDDRVLFESFEVDVLRRLSAAWTGRPFGLLVHAMDDDPVAVALELGAAAYNPDVPALLDRPETVVALHGAGVAVMVWTSDDPAEWRALTDLGVDAIITNTPGALLSWQRTRGDVP